MCLVVSCIPCTLGSAPVTGQASCGEAVSVAWPYLALDHWWGNTNCIDSIDFSAL